MVKRNLVTGATGFTGKHVCRGLMEKGEHVRALVRDVSRADDLQAMGVETVQGDLRDLDSLRRACEGMSVVYHIGALFRPENVTKRDFWETNALGTRKLLDSAIAAGVNRFVHCSTVGVHGDIASPPATEASPFAPGDHYQHSKFAGEMIVRDAISSKQICGVIFRPAGIYGPGDRRFLKLVRAVASRKFVMFGKGDVLYQMIYIDDLVDGILLCGGAEEAIGNTYILTGHAAVTLNQLVDVISRTVGVKPPRFHLPVAPLYVVAIGCEWVCKPLRLNPPLYRRRVDFFRKTRSFDISKARSSLNFSPRVDLETGMERTVTWYREQGWL